MRLAKFFLALTLTAVTLLMLSALVVYAPADVPDAPPAPGAPLTVELMPLCLPAADGVAAQPQIPARQRGDIAPVAVLLICALGLLANRDANGRVLCARRYENSFYPVFRPEVAGG